MFAGGCLCGVVRYRIHGAVGPSYYCHCSLCRKVSGSAFSSNAVVDSDAFAYVAGQDKVKAFTNAAGVTREFCMDCGSPLKATQGGQMRLRIGSLDTGLPEAPALHIYVGSKAEWHAIRDGLPQYDKRP